MPLLPPRVVIPMARFGAAVVSSTDIDKVVCHRIKNGNEEYLIKWAGSWPSDFTPYSWHPIQELAGADGLDGSSKDSALKSVQSYIIGLRKRKRMTKSNDTTKQKRKQEDPQGYRLSPIEREADAGSRASSLVSARSDTSSYNSPDIRDESTYNCALEIDGGYILAKLSVSPRTDTTDFPTFPMIERARSISSSTKLAEDKIRAEFMRELQNIKGAKPVKLVNTFDYSTPPLSFCFIDSYIYGEGVSAPDPDAVIGCKNCRPNMGGNCGCEYTKLCECLEYAEVDHKRLTTGEAELYKAVEEEGGSTFGLPKRFPYSKGTGYLVQAYINSGFPVYECNDKCACGPICKSRVVQKGRHVGLEIFKTRNRGWGLRSSETLATGEFIDTYRGEVITDEEAKRREEDGDKDKDSYLFSLDKHAVTDPYVVDGQYYGGPTRFINHSCSPNCGIYVVSYDKNNPYLYDLAFFALRQIAPGEELTFDYCAGMTQQQADTDAEADSDSIPCKCGSSQCRKWLWK